MFLFDFDGTLVDSMPTFSKVMLDIVRNNNIDVDEQEVLRTITPLGMKGAVLYLISLGVKGSVEEILKLITKDAYNAYATSIPAKKNVESTLKQLKSAGHSLNVLTASPHITLDVCLKRLSLFDLFDNVWSCEDFNTNKANPEIYKMAADVLKCDVQDVMFLDDNFHALESAKKAGCKTCGVYDLTSEEKTDDIKALADFYVSDFKELLDIVECN